MNLKQRSLFVALLLATAAGAQAPSPPPEAPLAESTDVTSVASMSWLYGCWGGLVNKRDFREQWMPLRGNTMIGVSTTVLDDKLSSYEYLRIEARVDGVFYVAVPSGKTEDAFKLVSIVNVNDARERAATYTFANPALEFPQRLIYRRGTEGWLYASVEGKVNGQDRQVTYPMRRIDCETGEFIRK